MSRIVTWVYPEDAKFPAKCCAWKERKDADHVHKFCLHCLRACHPHKHYHVPKQMPVRNESYATCLDFETVFCSPHCILAFIQPLRLYPTKLYHGMLLDMMTQYHDKPCWVFPAPPLETKENDQEFQNRLVCGQHVQVQKAVFYAPVSEVTYNGRTMPLRLLD